MKLSIFVLTGALFTAHFIDSKALLVKCPRRVQQVSQDIEIGHIEEYLFSATCKTILIEVHDPEQAMSLIRYVQPLKAHQKTIICKAPEYLSVLLSWCPFIDKVIVQEDDHIYDLKIALEDLAPYMQKNRKLIIEQHKPYIMVDESLHTLWREAFITDTNFKIGVACTSIYRSAQHDKKALTLQSFFPLACMQYISLYSLDDITNIQIPMNIHVKCFDQQTNRSLPDLAAIMNHLDLIITTQPLMVYIATALGKDVWFIASEYIDMNNLQSSYKNVHIFNTVSKRELMFDIMHELIHIVEKPKAQIVTAEIATGELIDKMTILEIKTERIHDEKKLENIWKELHSLHKTFDEFVAVTPELEQLMRELKAANEALYTTEDLIRNKEREKNFDNEFILLARSVYIQNDERCRVKREINNLFGSRLIEEKSYKPY